MKTRLGSLLLREPNPLVVVDATWLLADDVNAPVNASRLTFALSGRLMRLRGGLPRSPASNDRVERPDVSLARAPRAALGDDAWGRLTIY